MVTGLIIDQVQGPEVGHAWSVVVHLESPAKFRVHPRFPNERRPVLPCETAGASVIRARSDGGVGRQSERDAVTVGHF